MESVKWVSLAILEPKGIQKNVLKSFLTDSKGIFVLKS